MANLQVCLPGSYHDTLDLGGSTSHFLYPNHRTFPVNETPGDLTRKARSFLAYPVNHRTFRVC